MIYTSKREAQILDWVYDLCNLPEKDIITEIFILYLLRERLVIFKFFNVLLTRLYIVAYAYDTSDLNNCRF